MSEITKFYTNKHIEDYELEIKFGLYKYNYEDKKLEWNNGVSYVQFERLIKSLKELGNEEILEVSDVTIIGNNIRRIIIHEIDGDKIIWEEKIRMKDIQLQEYNCLISISKERILNEDEIPQSFVSGVIRFRKRHTFNLINNIIRIDATEISEMKDGINKIKYEVEIEFLGKIDEITFLDESLVNVFKLLKGSNNIYTSGTKKDIINALDKIDLVQTRNIKFRDLVFGGIVGKKFEELSTGNAGVFGNKEKEEKKGKKKNKEIVNKNVFAGKNIKSTEYNITFKADGLRKLLVIHNTGLWLLYNQAQADEFNLLLNKDSINFKKLFEKFGFSIFDGELVTLKIPDDIKYHYLVFDCLKFKGASVESLSFTERRKYVEDADKIIKIPKLLDVSSKETKHIKTPNDFFNLINYFLDKRDNLQYREDGIILTPINVIYNPHNDNLDLENRKLTKIPDICKWKDPKDMTIDFKIVWKKFDPSLDIIKLMVYDKKSQKDVEFNGTDIYPFPIFPDTLNKINNESDKIKLTISNAPTGTIVEFEWTNNMFRPRKIRYDKTNPNSLDIAKSNWEDINDPIKEEDIRGYTIRLSRKYHNRIKFQLYNELSGKKSINILDIGSGVGGDIDKWRILNGKIVAVEPFNFTGLYERLEKSDLKSRVKVVEVGGEDTFAITDAVRQFIPGGKVDAVTLMLSMSFFWLSNIHLDALVRTIVTNIKPGGKIIFFTINGDTVEEIFDGNGITDKIMASVKMHLHPKQIQISNTSFFGRVLDLEFPGTIVENQREYIVHIQDFTDRLEQYGFYLKQFEKADKEKLLSQDNLLYTSMYSYGYYENTDPHLLREELVETILPEHPLNLLEENIIIPKSPDIIVKNPDIMPKSTFKNPDIIPKSTFKNPDIISKLATKSLISPIDNDNYIPLRCSWYKNVVKIPAIRDENSFIHAVLKGFFDKYQENNDIKFRTELAKDVRSQLGILLSSENPDYLGHTYWETIDDGIFPNLLLQELKDPSLVNSFKIDYSPQGLLYYLNSPINLIGEIYRLISNIFDIDIYILESKNNDLVKYEKFTKNSERTLVLLHNDKDKFDLIAVKYDTGLQTVFSSNDPFITAIKKLYPLEVKSNEIFDPDLYFIDVFNLIFSDDDNILKKIYQIFPDKSDPFRLLIDRVTAPKILKRDRTLNESSKEILDVLESNGVNYEDIEQMRSVFNFYMKDFGDYPMQQIIEKGIREQFLNENDRESINNAISIL